jgi:quinol monooxygenase YgiN
VINRATDDSDAIWIYEVCRSQTDHQASLSNEAVKALIASARPLIAGMSIRMELVPLGGKGIPE